VDIHLTLEFGAVARAMLNPVAKWIATVAMDVKALFALAPVFEGCVGHLESLDVNLCHWYYTNA
jgi:hypothetical protein